MSMSSPVVDGVERAVFGPVPEVEVDAWLDRYVRRHLGSPITAISFRAGRISAVYGCRLDDGREIVVKVHRAGADTAQLAAAAQAQRHLADAGYPCPRPLERPSAEDGRTVVVESLLTDGEIADAAEPAVRRALATSLATQVQLLSAVRDAPALLGPLRAGAAAWARYEDGPWPTPHDPIFDFTHAPRRSGRVDELAAAAAAVLQECAARGVIGADVIGHGDWYDGNVLVKRSLQGTGASPQRVVVSAAFDWDSLVARPAPVIAGMSAGSHTAGGAANAVAPTVAQVAAFLDDYDEAQPVPFTSDQRAAASAAAGWVLAYNARCELCFLGEDAQPPMGSALHALLTADRGYVDLRF